MATLYRKQGQSQVIDEQGNLQNFSGNLDSLPIYNQNTITTRQLKPSSNINVGGFPVDNSAPNIEGDIAYFTQLQNQQSAQEQQLLEQKNSANSGIESLLRDLGGQGQEQLSLEQQYVNPLQAQIADLTGQANVLAADYQKASKEYDKLRADLEVGVRGRGNADIRASMLYGQQGAVDRAKASELNVKAADIALLQAQSLALQGKADLAQKQVDRAIDLKYKAKEQELAIKQFQLEQIKEGLTAEQTKRKEAQQYALKKEEDRIADSKALEKYKTEMTLTALSAGAPQQLIDQASKATNTLDAAKILGKYSPETLKYELLKQQIKTEKAQQSKIYNDINNSKMPQGVDGVIATLPKSTQERYYKLQGDFDQATKSYRGTIDAASSIGALSEKSTPQEQTAIIFQYMKTLDPTSTVREGEFALVGKTAGLNDRAVNAIRRLDKGARLNASQIKDIVGATQVLANNARKNLDSTSAEYDRRAAKFGLPTGLFYEPQQITQTNNEFSNVLGGTNQIFNTSNLKLTPSGNLDWVLPK